MVAVPTSNNTKVYAYKGVTDLKTCDNDVLSMLQAFARFNGGDRVIVCVLLEGLG